MKKNILKILLVLFCCLGCNLFSHAQDAGFWLSVNAEKKITQALSVSLSEEFRLNENMNEFGTFFTDAGLTYKINKYLRISANYRFICKRRLDDSYSNRHRYYFDLTVRKKFKPVTLSLRTRFQSQYADIFSSEDGKIPAYYLRDKLTIKYDAGKHIQPYFYAEIYTPLKHPYDVFIDKTRYCAGFEYEINRMNTIDVFYLFQKEYNVKAPETDYVIGLGYYLSF